ncbi:MAG: tyrosine-type recombinase/integrase [Steroidobacteraceae bacterium]
MNKAPSPNALARAVHSFFEDYIPTLRGLSRHTLLSYRDTLMLLLRFLATSRKVDPVDLDLETITPETVLEFLNHLEHERHNKVSSRNVRLAAIHAFFRCVSYQMPERIEQAQRILAIPFKRTGSRSIDYLEYQEICAVLNSIDRTAREGLRDYALLAFLFNTGARAQEVVDLNADALQLESPPQVKLLGKGRKTRICPLWPQTAQVIKEFVTSVNLDLRSPAPVFRNQRGQRLTRFGIRYILAKYCRRAVVNCPSLKAKRLHPHSARHSCAIYLLKSGVGLPDISKWLGHASSDTTNRYARVDLDMKRQALAKAAAPRTSWGPPAQWRQDTSVIEWLESL